MGIGWFGVTALDGESATGGRSRNDVRLLLSESEKLKISN